MQMTNHEVGNLVSAINKPKNQWKIKGKVERMRCSRRQEEKHGKSAKQKFRKLFANQFRNAKISQTSFAMRKFRKPNSQCENFAMRNFAMPKSISQCQFQFRNANSNFAMRKFRNAKFCNAKVHFALRNSNFAMRNFAMPKSISHCEIHCLCEIHPAKFSGLVILCN